MQRAISQLEAPQRRWESRTRVWQLHSATFRSAALPRRQLAKTAQESRAICKRTMANKGRQ